ncbi:heme o synthase [Aneurinibacillus terranovensis]|uniref:heme o synthase n=1 Tax=Aneurinibacillus terranovensis TaxID=278991 RepID=UPI00040CA9F3|nr:heme o synthase [Aneurinibacillus terranovensis]
MGAPVDHTVLESSTTYENPASRVMEPGPLSEAHPKGDWRDYVSVTKIGITVANLMMVFAGLWIGTTGRLDMSVVLLTMLGSALVVMSGTCLNNFIDRDLDKLMQRTKTRALPEGRLTPSSVLKMGILLGIIGTVLLASVNMLTAVLGLVGLFFYVVAYTLWTKRTTTLNTLVGGVAGAMPPVMGYAAVTNTMDMVAWVIFTVLFLWQVPHFLALAMRRADDYRTAGFQMLPAVRGFEVTKHYILSYTVALVPVTLLLFALGAVGKVYLAGMGILGLVYIVLNVSGFFMKDSIKFSRMSFVYSLIYLTMFSLLIMIDRV